MLFMIVWLNHLLVVGRKCWMVSTAGILEQVGPGPAQVAINNVREWWGEALAMATLLYNIMPHQANKNKSPAEL